MEIPLEIQQETLLKDTQNSKKIIENEPLLTVLDLSEYLGIPVQTLYGWRHENTGPLCLKAGRALRYRRSDVDNWLMEGVVAATEC